MTLVNRVRSLSVAAAASALLAFAAPAVAQEISEAHLKAARAAIAATHATDAYDIILPQAADALKTQLIQKNPDLTELISTTVDAKALELASRRADLEKEAAMAYARLFSEADLNAIAAFYATPAGMKILTDGPLVTREVAKAAEIWQNGLARDLAQSVGEALKTEAGDKVQTEGTTPAPAPAEGTAPAAPAPANPN